MDAKSFQQNKTKRNKTKDPDKYFNLIITIQLIS